MTTRATQNIYYSYKSVSIFSHLIIVTVFILCFVSIPSPVSAATSIWSAVNLELQHFAADTNAVNLGVRFISDKDGYITGIRFYKTAESSGPYKIALWQEDGRELMGEATFDIEKDEEGWQQVYFDEPIEITQATFYRATYFAPGGNYAIAPEYWNNGDFNIPGNPLHALANINGVYEYGEANQYPSKVSPFKDNYGVDIIFEALIPDIIEDPTVSLEEQTLWSMVDPLEPDSNLQLSLTVDRPVNLGLEFTSTVNGKINGIAFYKFASMNGQHEVALWNKITQQRLAKAVLNQESNDSWQIVRFADSVDIIANTTYVASLLAPQNYAAEINYFTDSGYTNGALVAHQGHNGVYVYGSSLAFPTESWNSTNYGIDVLFTPENVDQTTLIDSGTPIAIVTGNTAPSFAKYYAEILRAEGISSFDILDLSQLDQLPYYQVVILDKTVLTPTQVNAFNRWVEIGGRLVAMRPDAGLNDLLGISQTKGKINGAYYQAFNRGIAELPLQFHGDADLHEPLPGTIRVGTLLEKDKSLTSYPAITLRENIGPGNGKAVAFMYDVAYSVVLTRQGNPLRVSSPYNEDGVPRSSALFSEFINIDNFSIPQADEQQRLLVNVLHGLNNDLTPLPRFWYLPSGRKVAVVMTGDDHNANKSASFFETLMTPKYSPSGCSDVDWSCARATSWVYSNVVDLKNGEAKVYAKKGFEIAPHIAMGKDGESGCSHWSDEEELIETIKARRKEFREDYLIDPSGIGLSNIDHSERNIAPSSTNRFHCFAFYGWDMLPKVAREFNIRLDETYTPYSLEGTKNKLGRLNGSGIPMKFTALDGDVHDIYQFVSDWDYEYFDPGISYNDMKNEIGKALDSAESADGFWGFFGTHYDYSASTLEADFRAALLKAVSDRKIAMISAKQLLDWLDLRNESSFTNVLFQDGTLSFSMSINDKVPNPGLEAMLPLKTRGLVLTEITRSGEVIPMKRTFTVRNVPYVFFDAISSGNYKAVYR